MPTIDVRIDTCDLDIDEVLEERHANIEVDIDVDDFYDAMSDSEKREMVSLLEDDDFIDYKDPYEDNQELYSLAELEDSRGYAGKKFKQALLKLASDYSSLNKSTIDAIIALAD